MKKLFGVILLLVPGFAYGQTWGNPASYYSIWNSLSAAQVADVQTCTYSYDYGPIINAALNTYGAVFLPKGCYKINEPIHLTNQVLYGAGAAQTIVQSSDTVATDPIVYMGGKAKIEDMELSYPSTSLTGTETIGQRVGVETYDPTSNLALQRGGRIQNLYIYYVGTGIYDPPTESMFSVSVQNLEIQDYSYRGIDAEGADQTGSVWSNIYINDYTGSLFFPNNVDAGFVFGQCTAWGAVNNTGVSEVSIDQLNVEWSEFSTAVRFCGVEGVHAGTIHLEEDVLRNNYSGAVQWNSSVGSIGSLTLLYMPINVTGWEIFQIGDSNFPPGNAAGNTLAKLTVGNLFVSGLNDGQLATTHGLSSGQYTLAFRPTGVTGPFTVDIKNYVWSTFQSDSTYYVNPANDPHGEIFMVPEINGINLVPTVSACGTSPVVASGSTAFSGKVTVGSGGTTCIITFPGSGFPSNANGTVVDQAGSVPAFSITKTGVNISSAIAGHTYSWDLAGN